MTLCDSILRSCGIDPDTLPDTDRGPVYARHKAEVDAALKSAIDRLKEIRRTFRRCPDVDAGLDAMMPEVGQRLYAADMALGRFRATRECKGSS